MISTKRPFGGRALLSALATTLIFSSTNEAQAVSAAADCTSVNAVSIRDVGYLRINVEVGDFVAINPPTDPHDFAGDVGVTFFGATRSTISVPTSFVAAQDGVIAISQVAGGASITCTRTGSVRSLFFVRTQAQSIQTAILFNQRSRRGAGGNVATRNNVFVATRNLTNGISPLDTPEYNAWVALDGRRFEGDTDGNAANLTFGFDKDLGEDALIGGFLAYGRQELTDSSSTSTSRTPAGGVYYSTGLLDGLFLDANLGFARPQYNVDGAEFSADRWFGALSLSGRIEQARVRYSPFLTIQSVRESQPAYTGSSGAVAATTIDSHTGTLGVRMDATEPFGGVLPYISLAVDFARTTDSTGSEDDYVAPRLGLGLSADMGSGLIRFDIDAGKVSSSTRDIGANLSYEFEF